MNGRTKGLRAAAWLVCLALASGLMGGAASGECALEEHTHGEACYEKRLVCGLDEGETHAHDSECFRDELICPKAEHTHGAACLSEPEPTDAPTDMPTSEPTGSPADLPTDAPTSEPTDAPTSAPEAALSVRLTSDVRSCFAGDTVRFYVTIDGATEGASCTMTVEQGGQTLYSGAAEGELAVEAASLSGVTELRARATCTLADGRTAEATCAIPCALRVIEQPWQWEETVRIEKTGDWAQDLVAVARTQLGYRASEENFIVDEQGNRQGYTRYGAWWRASYSGWCAMYVSFCLNYAGVPESRVPWEANCSYWVRDLKERGLYDEAEGSEPEVGDLIFFDWDEQGYAGHMGIVSAVEEGKVRVIEGNHLKPVCEREYDIDLPSICGYGRITRAYEIYQQECLPDVDDALFEGGRGEIAIEASLRVRPQVGSNRLAILETGSELQILRAVQAEDGRWYEVQCGEACGYVRADLVRVTELSGAGLEE